MKGQENIEMNDKSTTSMQAVKNYKDECKICDRKVEDNQKGIKCDICEQWCHIKCVDVDEKAYKFLCKEELQWVCKVCIKIRKEDKEVYSLISDMMKMAKMEREKNDTERAQLFEMMKRMSDQITGLDKKVENKINERLNGVEKDILIKVNEEVEQKLEQFKRRKNIIIYALPEYEGRDENERDRIETDNLKQIFREINVDIDTFKIIRLGKQFTRNKIRPVKVELKEESEKYKILKKPANIRNTEAEKFKRVIITTDMTLKQRELEKILREELKVRREAGERNIKIKGCKIVKSREEGDRFAA